MILFPNSAFSLDFVGAFLTTVLKSLPERNISESLRTNTNLLHCSEQRVTSARETFRVGAEQRRRRDSEHRETPHLVGAGIVRYFTGASACLAREKKRFVSYGYNQDHVLSELTIACGPVILLAFTASIHGSQSDNMRAWGSTARTCMLVCSTRPAIYSARATTSQSRLPTSELSFQFSKN
jgi:hypothetical protein